MVDNIVMVAPCYGCEQVTTFCPDCVNTLLVDPATNLPPDVDAHGHPCEPDPAAVRRSIAEPLCDPCTVAANLRRAPGARVETEESRHARHMRALQP